MHCILKYLRSTVNWGKDESLICIGNAGLEGLFLKLSSAPWCEEQTAITSSWGHVLSKISSLVVDFWCWKLRVQSNILHRQYRCIHETICFLKSVLSNHMEHAHVIVLPYLESTWEVWVKKQNVLFGFPGIMPLEHGSDLYLCGEVLRVVLWLA